MKQIQSCTLIMYYIHKLHRKRFVSRIASTYFIQYHWLAWHIYYKNTKHTPCKVMLCGPQIRTNNIYIYTLCTVGRCLPKRTPPEISTIAVVRQTHILNRYTEQRKHSTTSASRLIVFQLCSSLYYSHS